MRVDIFTHTHTEQYNIINLKNYISAVSTTIYDNVWKII